MPTKYRPASYFKLNYAQSTTKVTPGRSTRLIKSHGGWLLLGFVTSRQPHRVTSGQITQSNYFASVENPSPNHKAKSWTTAPVTPRSTAKTQSSQKQVKNGQQQAHDLIIYSSSFSNNEPQNNMHCALNDSHFISEENREEMKPNEPEGSNSWQLEKQAKLYSDLLYALKGKYFTALRSLQKGPQLLRP